jgi:uncharacterized cupredoxin-like copper-binding protein
VTARSQGRPTGPWRLAFPWFLAALLLVSFGVPTAAAATRLVRAAPEIGYAHPETGLTVTLNMTDAPAFVPNYANVPEGTNVTFNLVNRGNFTHSFTVSTVPDLKLSTSLTPNQLYSFFAKNGSLANVSVGPGATGHATINFPDTDALDQFEFVSVVPYQFQAGMSGVINVTSTGPGVMVNESTINAPGFSPDVLAANGTHYPLVIDILVTNQGTLPHTFTVVPQSNVTLTPQNFTNYFDVHAPLANVNVPPSTGGTVWANFTVGIGVYQYLCEIPGHFEAGMDGLLYVGVPPPPVPAAPSTAIVEEWVLVGSAVLLGIGVLLAATASFVGRFPAPPKKPGHGH